MDHSNSNSLEALSALKPLALNSNTAAKKF